MAKGNVTLFLLGLGGMGLSLAMFLDAQKQPTEASPEGAAAEDTLEDTVEDATDDTPEDTEPVVEQEEEPSQSEYSGGEESEAEVEPEDEDEKPMSYRDMYRADKRRKYDEYEKAHAYKGDGTEWSKRMYALKEAYRRSRETTPVDPLIRQRVKYKNEKISSTDFK